MLLALLMLVVGRLGGPLGGVGAAPLLMLETERAMGGGTLLLGGAPSDSGTFDVETERGGPPGGPAPGRGVQLTERGVLLWAVVVVVWLPRLAQRLPSC